jgi:hypothetical protein
LGIDLALPAKVKRGGAGRENFHNKIGGALGSLLGQYPDSLAADEIDIGIQDGVVSEDYITGGNVDLAQTLKVKILLQGGSYAKNKLLMIAAWIRRQIQVAVN